LALHPSQAKDKDGKQVHANAWGVYDNQTGTVRTTTLNSAQLLLLTSSAGNCPLHNTIYLTAGIPPEPLHDASCSPSMELHGKQWHTCFCIS
jgi:hypothetical protein